VLIPVRSPNTVYAHPNEYSVDPRTVFFLSQLSVLSQLVNLWSVCLGVYFIVLCDLICMINRLVWLHGKQMYSNSLSKKCTLIESLFKGKAQRAQLWINKANTANSTTTRHLQRAAGDSKKKQQEIK
jgi:hypothetical protein